ncbi:MAG: CBS domain-containing protein [bacterium]|nr:CBS domain-containing protein [bacterium]
MLYFSEVKGKKVYTEDNVYIGRLQDLIFIASEKPNITKIVIKTDTKEKLNVPIEYLKKINSHIVIAKNYQTTELIENELFVDINVVDKQVIDIKGNKVVRVNDIVIQDKPTLYIAGADIGILGILRWLKIEHASLQLLTFLGLRIVPNFLSWADIHPLELAQGRVRLKKEEDKLEKIRPEDLADYLEKTNIRNVTKILNILEDDFAAEVIGNLNVNYQTVLFRSFSPEKSAKIISLVDPDDAADILLTLSKKRREVVINILSSEKKKEVEYLLHLAKTPIGGLITSEYLALSSQLSVGKTMEAIKREAADFSFFSYVYVTNEQNQLIGVISLHELLLQHVDTPLYKCMRQDVVVIHLTTPEEIAVNKMLKYKLHALPVLDREKKILGIVTFDDMADFILSKLSL